MAPQLALLTADLHEGGVKLPRALVRLVLSLRDDLRQHRTDLYDGVASAEVLEVAQIQLLVYLILYCFQDLDQLINRTQLSNDHLAVGGRDADDLLEEDGARLPLKPMDLLNGHDVVEAPATVDLHGHAALHPLVVDLVFSVDRLDEVTIGEVDDLLSGLGRLVRVLLEREHLREADAAEAFEHPGSGILSQLSVRRLVLSEELQGQVLVLIAEGNVAAVDDLRSAVLASVVEAVWQETLVVLVSGLDLLALDRIDGLEWRQIADKLLVCHLFVWQAVHADDFPRFRGPNILQHVELEAEPLRVRVVRRNFLVHMELDEGAPAITQRQHGIDALA